CSFCGVSGLKPTYGAVSRYGLIAYASSLDQIGPMGKTVADCAAVFSVISGKDKKDGTSMEVPKFDLEKANLGNVKGKIIGIPEDYLAEGIAEDVKQSILDAAKKFEELGATIETFKMPIVKYAIPAYYIIACAEASSNLSRYDGIKYGYSSPSASNLSETYIKSRSEAFGMEVKRRIMLGNFVLSSGYYDAYYKKALQAKALVQKAFNEAFLKYDMLLGPVAPTTALKIGESLSDPLKMYLGDIYTVMINIAGLPSMSVPCGFDNEDMPIGMQIIGKPFEEAEIMNAATAFQNSTEYHKRLPILR
ncbi:MAG: amidase family protein, partial [Oscillospiraceae bacterium]